MKAVRRARKVSRLGKGLQRYEKGSAGAAASARMTFVLCSIRHGDLFLLGNRYYDPATGRFISQDPARDESNGYAYCGQEPLVAVDPSGLARQALAQRQFALKQKDPA